MKKIIFFVLVFAMSLSLVACGSSSAPAKTVKEVQEILKAEGWIVENMDESNLNLTQSITAKEGIQASKTEGSFEGISYAMMANKEDAEKFMKEGTAEFDIKTEDAKTGLGDDHQKFNMMGMEFSFIRKGQHIAIFTGLDMDTTKAIAKKMGL